MANPELERLQEAKTKDVAWRKWGPYLSERQWGTVREDYSENGDAWSYFTHDQARSRAYRWGEDGLGGISDDKQALCFAIALWNGQDGILKERLFGLTNAEGNHGEDVKEYYYYLDSTPTHSYMHYLYKYPQAAFPYDDLVATNRSRSREELEYELIDTGIFAEDRYFDVFVEYAKAGPDDVLVRITAANRGPEPATLHLLPTLWFRNDWTWTEENPRPSLHVEAAAGAAPVLVAEHVTLGRRYLYCDTGQDGALPTLLFTENETNTQRLWNQPNPAPYVKDSINDYIVKGQTDAVNPAQTGTKASAHYPLTVAGGESVVVRLRLTDQAPGAQPAKPAGKGARKKSAPGAGAALHAAAFGDFDAVFATRKQEADIFYGAITPPNIEGKDSGRVMRQALAGMLWSKQYYYFDLDRWLAEHKGHPLLHPNGPASLRNRTWFHMMNADIISMPDKWEYPWYAAWDLAFHCIALAMVDIDFAKHQLDLMLRDLYLHPNGQIPAYEWNFSDVNPPVHAWATIFVYTIEKDLTGKGDLRWLERSFQKLLLNFTWWVNRKDPGGRNVFEGGFLGLDNIGVFDRSSPLPTGGYLEQADGTAWMAFFSQNMLQIAIELSRTDKVYEDQASRFAEHFLRIAGAMDRIGNVHDEMWDEADGFFYDLLRYADGDAVRLKVRSMVGLLPLCASTVIESEDITHIPLLRERTTAFVKRHRELCANIAPLDKVGKDGRILLSILNEDKLRRILARVLNENEFFSPYGIRALSRDHADHPYTFDVHGQHYEVGYLPAESDNGMFGGNSNWRGPIWMPVNMLIVRSLLHLYAYYGDDFKVECPTGSGEMKTLYEVSREISKRLALIFVRDAAGKRAVYGRDASGHGAKFQDDPHWRDYILFYEYFHGDNGAGLGASHQTGWTGLVARLLQYFSSTTAEDVADGGLLASSAYLEPA
jgi:hypothetical protein